MNFLISNVMLFVLHFHFPSFVLVGFTQVCHEQAVNKLCCFPADLCNPISSVIDHISVCREALNKLFVSNRLSVVQFLSFCHSYSRQLSMLLKMQQISSIFSLLKKKKRTLLAARSHNYRRCYR